MCKSAAEGGQRCAAHTRARYEATTPADPQWDTVAAEYASTPEGAQALQGQIAHYQQADNPRAVARLSSAVERGRVLRESNQAAAAAIKDARPVSDIDPSQLRHAIDEASALNPDGWAVDPEDTLGSIQEPAYELLERDGREAAVEYLRTTWRNNRDRYRASNPNDIAGRGRYAALMVEAVKLATDLNNRG